MAGILAYFFGASGEIDVDIRTSGSKKTQAEGRFARYHAPAQGVFVAAA
jgi:hypothetical protein